MPFNPKGVFFWTFLAGVAVNASFHYGPGKGMIAWAMLAAAALLFG